MTMCVLLKVFLQELNRDNRCYKLKQTQLSTGLTNQS